MTKILIFYSRTGGGHLRAAEAIASSLLEVDGHCEVSLHDGLQETALGFKIDASSIFALLSTRLIPLFNALYILTNNRLGIRVLRFLIRLVWGRRFRAIVCREQPDAILSTHHFMSPSTVERTSCPFVTLVTDLSTPHLLWFDASADAVILPSTEMLPYAENALRSDAGAKCMQLPPLVSFGFPVARRFHTSIGPQARTKTNRLLVMAGGVGAGGLEKTVTFLADRLPGFQMTVVCGWNDAARRNLSGAHANVSVLGFVDQIDKVMRDADIVITKAGPGTIMESATAAKPLIITGWVGLQEKGNVDFVVRNGLGVYCPDHRELVSAVQAVYRAYDTMGVRADRFWSDGCPAIARFLLERERFWCEHRSGSTMRMA